MIVAWIALIYSAYSQHVAVVVDASSGYENLRNTVSAIEVAEAYESCGYHVLLFSAQLKTMDSRLSFFKHSNYSGAVISGQLVTEDSILNTLESDLPGHGPDRDLVVFVVGHGSNGYIRLHGSHILSKQHLARALSRGHRAGQFRSVRLVVDTCHGGDFIDILARKPWYSGVSSSDKRENSYSAGADRHTGVSLDDRFSIAFAKTVREKCGSLSLHELQHDPAFSFDALGSTVTIVPAKKHRW